DLQLFAEGNHFEIYRKLGAQVTEIGGVKGTTFAVWAPNAERVSVVGDFNNWNGRVHPMRKLLHSGIWEIFLPGIGEGAHYKFETKPAPGALLPRRPPSPFYTQHRLQTASMVWDMKRYRWDDTAWMERRRTLEWHRQPISIYEVHLGSWMRLEA